MRAIGDCGADDWADEDWVGIKFYYFPDLHFSEQYLTFSQSLAHFLRHSNCRPHLWQILGGKPFFVFALMESVSVYLKSI